MTTLYASVIALVLILLLAWLWRQFANAPLVGKVSQCSWCSGWYGADGIARPDRPKVFSDPVSHGICKCCFEKEKSALKELELDRIKQSISRKLEASFKGE